MKSLEELRDRLRQFVAERDWDQFHSPKNLASALSVEAAELLEHFQWLTEAHSKHLAPEKLAQVRDEMADVLVYLVRLADFLLRAQTAGMAYRIYQGEGRDPEGKWRAEPSVLIMGIPLAEAEALARKLEQNAIVWIEKGRAPQLVVLV